MDLPESDHGVAEENLELLQGLGDKIATTVRLVEELRASDDAVEWLSSVPGIDSFSSGLIRREVKDIRRFATAKHFVSHIGLAPLPPASAARVPRAGVMRQGNAWLRWVFTEAVAPAIRSAPFIRRYYEKIKARRGASNARVATARKLAELAWTVWTERRCYEEREPSGSGSPSALDMGVGAPPVG